MFKKIAIILVLVLMIGALSGCTPVNSEPDTFAPGRIIVMMTHEESLKCRDYTPADFPEIQCVRVQDLTQGTKVIAKAKLANDPSLLPESHEDPQEVMGRVNLETFRVILTLYLEKPGKQNVLDAIEKLKQRNDIESAEPDYYIHMN